jgi:Protein of unknown function (DUF1616)
VRHTTPWTDLLLGLCVLGAGVMFVAFGPEDRSGLGVSGLGGAARLAFGFLGLLLVPGYVAAAALFPGRSDIDPVSRGALALGLSVAAVPLIALLLNQTPWGIRPLPMALALLLLSLLLSGVAVMRRLRAHPASAGLSEAGQEGQEQSEQNPSAQNQFIQRQSGRTTQLRPVHSGTTQVWATRVDAAQARTTNIWESPSGARRPPRRPRAESSRYARPLLVGLLAMTVAIGVVGGLTIQQRAQQSFTEFYLLGSAGKLSKYPYRVQAGQLFEVRLGVLNRERLAARYTIRTAGCEQSGGVIAVPKLEPGQEWQGRLQCSVAAQTTALRFQLVRGGSLEAYRTLSLQVQPGVPAN